MCPKAASRLDPGWVLVVFLLVATLMTGACSDDEVPGPASPLPVQVSLGGTDDDYFTRHGASSLALTADRGFLLLGTSDSKDGDLTENKGLFDLWVVRLSSDLELLWQKSLGGSREERTGSVLETPDGGFLVAGYTESSDGDVSDYHGGGDAWLVRLDASGNVLWARCFGGSRLDEASAVLPADDGGFVVAGHSSSNDGDAAGNTGAFNGWIFKVDGNGNLLWQRSVGGSDHDRFQALGRTSDGGVVAVGHSLSSVWAAPGSTAGTKVFAVRLDRDGAVRWIKSVPMDASGAGTAVQETSNGDLLVSGWGVFSGSGKDMLLARLDAGGELLWTRNYGGSASDSAFAMVQYDGRVYLAGESYSSDGDFPGSKGQSDMVVVRLDESGAIQGYVRLGGSDRESAGAIHLVLPPQEPVFLVSGWTGSRDGDVKLNHGGRDIWLVKVRSDLGT